LKHGASAVLTKAASRRELLQALRAIKPVNSNQAQAIYSW
jgi:hypothetical protein